MIRRKRKNKKFRPMTPLMEKIKKMMEIEFGKKGKS